MCQLESTIAQAGLAEMIDSSQSVETRLSIDRRIAGRAARLLGSRAMETRHLGQASALPASPEEATLDYVPNPRPGALYLVRFAAPEFTSLCPVTGQPDFAHLVIDYAPAETIVESKSLKLFLGAFRNHAGFHEDVTVGIGQRLVRRDEAAMAAHRRLLVSARRHADRRLLAVGRAPGRAMAARPGRAAYRGRG